MKAFLSSHFLEQKHFDAFGKLLGKPKARKALFITAAAVPDGLNPKPKWLQESLGDMSRLTEGFDETSLEEGETVPHQDLSPYDFVFVSGGNVFYLACRLAQTGLDASLKDYVARDGLYAGSSAGAIILMDDFSLFAPVDEPQKAPGLYPGLGLISFAPVVHADSPKYGAPMQGIAEAYRKEGKEVVLLNDNQVLVINGQERFVV